LDHVLGLIAGTEWSSRLVLRGSMLMTAYAGSSARKPGDLDFVVMKDGWPVEDLDPYPYVDELAIVQQWPEAADGAGRADLWADEEFETGGLHPRVAPEGTNWIRAEDWEEPAPYGDLRALLRENAQVGDGIVLDVQGFDESSPWAYSGYAMLGARVTVPWRVDGRPGSGVVQMDFAMDEPMPWRPVWTRIPRLDGGFSVMRAASPELSLAWKLMWLIEDSKGDGVSRGKDLYDAVVLAELGGLAGLGGLGGLRGMTRVGGLDLAGLTRRDVEGARVDWDAFVAEHPAVEGSVGAWKQRLVDVLGLL
jgi:hypothetical protein